MSAAASTGSRERWRRTKQIFDAVADLDPEEKDTLLRELTGDDLALRRDVVALLKEDGSPSGAISTTAARRLQEGRMATLPSMTGVRIGAYRIVREIGCGGMGAVFKAERVDGDGGARRRPDAGLAAGHPASAPAQRLLLGRDGPQTVGWPP